MGRAFTGFRKTFGRPRLGRMQGGGGAALPVSAIIFGQSEMEHLLNAGSFYRQITQPTPGDGNLIVYTQSGDGVAPVKTIVNAATVTAGQVNPAIAALSAFLAFAVPGRQFVIGDGAVGGTSRRALMDDSTDGTDERLWSDFTSVIDAVEAETGQPLGHLIECWYNSDGGSISTFKASFWPHYFGTTDTGASFTLGTPSGGRNVDHCLWDGTAAASAKGRGVFARSATLWHILTPMPFLDAPVAPTAEMTNFSENGERLSEPARATMHSLTSDALAQSVGLRVGPSAHICNFGGASGEAHPDVENPDGQILLMWPIAAALLRASGRTINEPQVVAVEGPDDGTYADLLISLPNGGTLTTLAALESRAAYAGAAPHQQAVTGIEITRGGSRRPVYKTSETSYPVGHRGTVVIQSASETHVTHGQVGRVRITPTTPFAFGNAISYLRGQATAVLQEPRDDDLYPYFLLEHIPSLYDAGALYKFPGVAVRPFQEDLPVTVPAPSFVARSAVFDGGDYFNSSAISVAAGSVGLFSAWVRQPTWVATKNIFELRLGSTITMQAITSSSGRMGLRVNQDGTGTDTFTTPTNLFLNNTWAHILWAWDWPNSRFQLYINGVAINTSAYSFTGATKFDMSGNVLNRIGIGAAVGGSQVLTGEIGHLWCSVNQTLDLSVSGNRAKFLNGLVPADLGSNGQLPTGTAPEWYYDGDGAAWANLGTAGNVTLTGALTVGGSPSL